MPKPKLELTWIGKENRPRLEPRILIEDPALSYHAKYRYKTENLATENTKGTKKDGEPNSPPTLSSMRSMRQNSSSGDLFDNQLIFGDNLLALKALEAEYTGKVKCVFIDPPYNTGSAFTHYDDGVEHSIWLGLMRDRLEIIKRLMAPEGSLWITIDDNECHYLKVLCDEVFGRTRFIANLIWQKRTSRENRAAIGSAHDHVLLYSNSEATGWKEHRNLLPSTEDGFSNPDNDPRGPWRSIPFSAQGWRPNQMYKIETPNGGLLDPPKGRCWGATEEVFKQHRAEGRVYFPKGGDGRPRIKTYMGEEVGLVPNSIFLASDAGDNQQAKKEILTLFPDDEAFSTPKPEKLLKLILTIATTPGDLVLDSFAGSGTTGAVAHKMGRRWIMIELGEHCHTHIIPRLKKVIDGQDSGGITEAVGWKGGGGFRYYRLAPSLLEKDKWGNWVINKQYNAAQLAEALCKLEGFTYAPSDTEYFIHGHSTETDFLYVTTQNLGHDQLALLSDEVGTHRTLLVLCAAFRANAATFANLTIKKIPNTVLTKCEWGHDDYSLAVENLPSAPTPKVEQPELFGGDE